MRLILKLNLGNDTFQGETGGEEAARILRDAARQLEEHGSIQHYISGALRDKNGNSVGKFNTETGEFQMAGFHEVTVSNIGKVLESDNGFAARTCYNSYVGKSKRNEGRAAGESVTLWLDGEPIKEFLGELQKKEMSESN